MSSTNDQIKKLKAAHKKKLAALTKKMDAQNTKYANFEDKFKSEAMLKLNQMDEKNLLDHVMFVEAASDWIGIDDEERFYKEVAAIKTIHQRAVKANPTFKQNANGKKIEKMFKSFVENKYLVG